MERIAKGFIEKTAGTRHNIFSLICTVTVTLSQLLKIDDCAKNDPSILGGEEWRTRDFPLHINPSCMILNIFYDH